MRFLLCALTLAQTVGTTFAAAQTPRPARRQPVTPELERSAFTDATARSLLHRARAARLAQDSALRAYDARTYLRLSVGLGIRRLGRDRLLLRTEHAARVRWARGSGIWVEPIARRTGFPMGGAQLDLTEATPIPYFPGRETLWMPRGDLGSRAGVAQAEVNENEMLHPLATGAEAYYRYATGDSITIRLADDRTIALRELRITARRPEWRAFVGSFWFDVERGSLVRAAYRMAAALDLWELMSDEQRRRINELEEKARTDTGAAARQARRAAARARDETGGEWIAKGLINPMRANLSAITVEYGLYEGRFWLPRLNVAEGEYQAGFIRVPVKFEESFRYNSVNATDPVPAVPAAARSPGAEGDTAVSDEERYVGTGYVNIGLPGSSGRRADTSTAARRAREDSLLRRYAERADSLRAAAEQARAKGDTTVARELSDRAGRLTSLSRQILRRRGACATGDSTYYAGTSSRYNGALRVAVRMPCDASRLDHSTELPGSIYDAGEELFGAAERDALLDALDMGLQPDWAPQRPEVRTGFSFLRYNRIEALSLGATATSVLGRGYTAEASARLGIGDWVPNGELALSRSNGRTGLRLGLFHRLGVANDDWGAPLSLGASLANLLYARDEGFYYRTWGAELAGTREEPGPFGGATVGWRLFAERQRSAGREANTQASLANLFGGTHFYDNIEAARLTAVGAGADLSRTFGADPLGFRLDARLRGEGAWVDGSESLGTTGYGRFMVDGTLSRPFGRLAAAITGAAGTSAGDLPPQRLFYVGGLHTVRGQFARPEGEGRVGDAFWLTRAEAGFGFPAVRPALFYDVGWAGPRADLGTPGRPLSGAGAGVSLLDGIVRFDVSRGIHPEKRWRVDLYLDARF